MATIRNVGGHVTPDTLNTLAMLRKATQKAGGDLGPGWELIVLHHTDCGITRLADGPEMLSEYFTVDPDDLPAQQIADPYHAVVLDVAALRAEPQIQGAKVSGCSTTR